MRSNVKFMFCYNYQGLELNKEADMQEVIDGGRYDKDDYKTVAVGPTNQPKGFSQKFGTDHLWLVAGEGEFVELVQTTWDNHFDPVSSGGWL